MDWKDRLLRLFAEGLTDKDGRRLDTRRVVRTLDRIDADPAVAARLNDLPDSAALRHEFLVLYESEPASE